MEVTQKNKHLSQTIMQREQDIRRSALTGKAAQVDSGLTALVFSA